MARPFFTIGHSTHSLEVFAGLLREAGCDLLVDVRKLPGSNAFPQFNGDVMPEELAPWQIGYHYIPALGGRRGRQKTEEPSPNGLWRNKSFRNYADYALTPAFREGLAELVGLGGTRTCAIMCAEVLWWRCHRRIIADYLLARGEDVRHIMGTNDIKPAVMTPGALPTDAGVIYPPA